MQQLTQWGPSHAYVNDLNLVVDRLSTDIANGLSEDEAAERLRSEGANAIQRTSDVQPIKILIEQFKSSVVILLLVAAGISSILREYLQTAGIIVAVFVNALVGFVTEFRAKVSLEKLSHLAGATARVRRNGKELLVSVSELVRGDVLLLQPGDRVPADCRLVEAPSLSVNESILTGESVPVWKTSSHSNSWEESVLFQGTSIAGGRALAVIISTGKDTRLGALAVSTRAIDDTATPLQIALDRLGQKLTWVTIVVCAIVGVLGITLRGLDLLRMLETSIALAVAAIPEGLPVVATLALAIGIRRMVRKRALVRCLTAVETLGCTTVICTDKTGTLTENKMKVTAAFTRNGNATFSGTGYEPDGMVNIIESGIAKDAAREELERTLIAGALCNDAVLQQKDNRWEVVGDPTEGALLVAARKLKFDERELAAQYTRIVELPFELERKRMSTMHGMDADDVMVFCKGSPEVLLPLCTRIGNGNSDEPLSEAERQSLLKRNTEMAAAGLRVLCIAQRKMPHGTICIDPANLETDLTFLGLVGMADSLRPNIEDAIMKCKRAGIRILMLTGDQQHTAEAVGRNIGIADVLARVTPEMKLSVVRELRSKGEIVAMTGDGVNDAPALKQSNIGVAMGESGSDLARDASDLVITDDNFATIVSAIEEGRAIYRNIKRAVAYLLTASLSSVMVVAVGILVNKELLLSPLQLLWLNLIMHIFPGIGLVMQRDTRSAMFVPPRDPRESILTPQTLWSIIARSCVVAAATSFTPMLSHREFAGAQDSSIFLVVVSLSLLMQSWSWLWDRSANADNAFSMKTISNGPMWGATILGVVMVLIAVYVPALQPILQTQPLDIIDWQVSLAVAVATFAVSLILSKITLGFQSKGRDQSAEKRMKDEAVSARL